MSDIVERLKNWNHGIPKTMIVSEAIAEIERLNAQVERLQANPSEQRYWEQRWRDEHALIERANKRFADILDCVDGNKTGEIEKIATRAMLECQGYPLTSTDGSGT